MKNLESTSRHILFVTSTNRHTSLPLDKEENIRHVAAAEPVQDQDKTVIIRGGAVYIGNKKQKKQVRNEQKENGCRDSNWRPQTQISIKLSYLDGRPVSFFLRKNK